MRVWLPGWRPCTLPATVQPPLPPVQLFQIDQFHPLRAHLQWAWKNYDDLIMDLQRRAYEAALRLVAERATVIRTVGNELCDNK